MQMLISVVYQYSLLHQFNSPHYIYFSHCARKRCKCYHWLFTLWQIVCQSISHVLVSTSFLLINFSNLAINSANGVTNPKLAQCINLILHAKCINTSHPSLQQNKSYIFWSRNSHQKLSRAVNLKHLQNYLNVSYVRNGCLKIYETDRMWHKENRIPTQW